MFERYPAESVRMLFLARAGAAATGAKEIDAKHLLTGALAAREVPPPSGYPQLQGAQSEIPFSEHVKRVLSRAAMTADRLGHHRICPEHVLIALIDDDLRLVEAVQTVGVERSEVLKNAERHAAIDDSPLPVGLRAQAVLKRQTDDV